MEQRTQINFEKKRESNIIQKLVSIIKLCQERKEGLTKQQIALATNISYYPLRNYLNFLVQVGVLVIELSQDDLIFKLNPQAKINL